MNIITTEYLSSVKMNLQGRNNSSLSEHFQGSYPCEIFPRVYTIVCFVMIPMTKDASHSNKEVFFHYQGNYFADE